MKNIVVGTAGHIDHGKTTLVRALTGIDTDRLEEEKRRGISIDLGFAHLNVSESLRVAFIDVPGHERFIKNMLAGVGGIDAVMLVIAADESVKPQTREHFDICRLLRIPLGLIALTKIDAVDPDLVELTRMETEDFVAGSFLAGCPIVPVSAKTGAGIPELKAALGAVADRVPERSQENYFRVPLDRSFMMQGFGTVVTGTVVNGSVSIDDEVETHPGGKRARIRGIQVHGKPGRKASAGQRAALNIAGLDVSDVSRGTVLTAPERFRASSVVDCLIELLASAQPLKNRAPVHVHAGTAETIAEVRSLDRTDTIQPGSTAAVRLVLRDPMVLIPGDRFVIRKFSPLITIGGGEVVDPFAPRAIRRDSAQRVLRLGAADARERIATIVADHPGGLSIQEVSTRTGYAPGKIERSLPASVLLIRQPQDWLLDREWLKHTSESWRNQVAEFHRNQPLLPGLRREELRSRELPDAPSFLFDLVLSNTPSLKSTGDVVHLTSHKLALQQDEEAALRKIESAFEQSGLAVPSVQAVLRSSGVEEIRARNLLQVLLRNKRLIRVTEDLIFHPHSVAALRSLLAGKKGSRFGVSEFKDWTGISRKYAIPLLEFLDRERVTRREGDSRVVL